MSLDKVLIMNLDRRADKYWFAMGVLSLLGYLPKHIDRFSAHDGQDYADAKAVHDAAVADGFPKFSEYESDNKRRTAWFWTWCSALRQITESDETVLLLIDDILPAPFWTYGRMNSLVRRCYGLDEQFRMLQLMHTRMAHEVYDPHHFFNEVLARGLAGSGDQANVFNPDGAAHLLDICTKSPGPAGPHGSLEILFQSEDQSGLWHTVDEICRGYYSFGSDLSTG